MSTNQRRRIALADTSPSAVQSSADAPVISTSVLQLAKVGSFKNHPTGEFELSVEIFEQIVENFERYTNDIPLDFEHASESPSAGGVFQLGAPAVGWIVSVESRGDEGLFGTVEWVDERAVEMVRKGQYRYLSPAIIFNATDPETGDDIGALLVSAALTNRPYLDAMEPVAARAQTNGAEMTADELRAALADAGLRATDQPARMSDADKQTREKIIESLRQILYLPEMSPESDVIAALDRLEQLVKGDMGEKDGIDVPALISSLRWRFALGQLTSATEVIAQIRNGIAQTEPAAQAAATAARNPSSTTVSASTKEPRMATEEKSPEHVQLEKDHATACAKHAAFKSAVCKALKMDDKHEAAEDEIIKKIEDAAEQLEKLQQAAEARAKSEAEADVEKVAASMKCDDEQKKDLLAHRLSQPEAFKRIHKAALTATAAPPAATQQTPPTDIDSVSALALVTAAAKQAGATPNAIADMADRTAAAAALSQKLDAAAKKLCAKGAPFEDNYGAALKHVASLVESGQPV